MGKKKQTPAPDGRVHFGKRWVNIEEAGSILEPNRYWTDYAKDTVWSIDEMAGLLGGFYPKPIGLCDARTAAEMESHMYDRIRRDIIGGKLPAIGGAHIRPVDALRWGMDREIEINPMLKYLVMEGVGSADTPKPRGRKPDQAKQKEEDSLLKLWEGHGYKLKEDLAVDKGRPLLEVKRAINNAKHRRDRLM